MNVSIEVDLQFTVRPTRPMPYLIIPVQGLHSPPLSTTKSKDRDSTSKPLRATFGDSKFAVSKKNVVEHALSVMTNDMSLFLSPGVISGARDWSLHHHPGIDRNTPRGDIWGIGYGGIWGKYNLSPLHLVRDMGDIHGKRDPIEAGVVRFSVFLKNILKIYW